MRDLSHFREHVCCWCVGAYGRRLPSPLTLVCVAPQIIAAQEEMLRKEKELCEARKKLAMIRQQQYKFLPSELREDSQDQ